MVPDVKISINGLNAILSNPDQLADLTQPLPFFPIFPAGQVFAAQPKVLHVENGSGLRYVTMYSQWSGPVANDQIFYTFQGISKDGHAYIIAILPINASSLGPTQEAQTDDEFGTNYDHYIQGIKEDLNGLRSSDFTPSLDELDQMIETISFY